MSFFLYIAGSMLMCIKCIFLFNPDLQKILWKKENPKAPFKKVSYPKLWEK